MTAEDVHVTFSRPAEAQRELWNTEDAREIRLESLAPGEAYTSMFCSPIGWDGEPVTVNVRYRNGRLLGRLASIDPDEHWWRRVLGDVLKTRIRHRKDFTLDPLRFFAFRANVGYAGKKEMERIADAAEKMQRLVERRDTEARHRGLRQRADSPDDLPTRDGERSE